MEGHASPYLLHFIIGAVIVASFLLKPVFRRIGVPSLVGFLLLGVLISGLDAEWNIVKHRGENVFEFLASTGLIILLFRTGLESDTSKLRQELGPAGLIWLGNFFLSGILGYLTAYYILDLGLITSLIIATAFTATSIAVSIGIWREAGITGTRESNMLLNVAQMDDISGIAALALLLSLIPMLSSGGAISTPELLSTLGVFALNLFLFSAGCVLFARYIESPMTKFFEKISHTESCLMLMTAGTAVMISAIAEGLGLSLAVGALFAGLVFSQNPEAKHIDKMLIPLYDLFAPFFFIGIGLSINPALFISGFSLGLILLIPAVIGKVIGGALPALRYLNINGSLALGLSLVPRAEIMLVIAGSASQLAPEYFPDEIFAGIIFISAVTCILTPPLVRPFLSRMKDSNEECYYTKKAKLAS